MFFPFGMLAAFPEIDDGLNAELGKLLKSWSFRLCATIDVIVHLVEIGDPGGSAAEAETVQSPAIRTADTVIVKRVLAILTA